MHLYFAPSQIFHDERSILPAYLLNLLKKQPTRVAGERILQKFTNILKYLDINSQQLTKNPDNPANRTTIHSEHSQQLKRSRLQEKF